MIKTFKPMNGKVTVREFKPKAEKTENGIILAKEEHAPAVLYGEIVEAGTATKENPVTVNAGDKIAYPVTDGRYINVNGEKLKLLESKYIIGVYTD